MSKPLPAALTTSTEPAVTDQEGMEEVSGAATSRKVEVAGDSNPSLESWLARAGDEWTKKKADTATIRDDLNEGIFLLGEVRHQGNTRRRGRQ